jgi:hypothetical protein
VEDDFDELVQEDAKHYSADLKWQKDRANVKSQNKTLKAAGKKLLKPPSKPSLLLSRSSDDEDHFSDESKRSLGRQLGRGRARDSKKKVQMEGCTSQKQ